MREQIAKAVDGHELSAVEIAAAIENILTGQATHAQTAALLIALRMKGETVGELAAAARVMRQHALAVRPRHNEVLLDTCGTGGDGSDSFNISTVAAIVVAAAGVRVAKHGNRSASSKCGSADILEALGVKLDTPADGIARQIDDVGIGFMFARVHHPAMRHVAPVRSEIGVRTIFNFMGPLTNPAGATHQLLGVGDGRCLALMADALLTLGCVGAWVVHGEGGLDEVSLAGPTRVIEVRGEAKREHTVSPEDFGLDRQSVELLRGGDAARNAEIAHSVLEGSRGACRDAVILNAAAALCVVDPALALRDAATRARDAIDSGAAKTKLAKWVASSASEG